MYIVHEDFSAFLAAVVASPATTIYIQETAVMVDPTSRVLRTGLYLTAIDNTVVRAAHIRIESASLFTSQLAEVQVREAMNQRLATARQCVDAAVHAVGRSTASGMALVPGLLEDIKRFSCSHTLWTWQDGDLNDVASRHLIPANMSRAA